MPTPTKVTITLQNGTVKTYWAADPPTINYTNKTKSFVGKRDGESTSGTITLHIGTYVDQKEEPGSPP